MADSTKLIEDILSSYGSDLVASIRDQLKSNGKIASGNLYNSVVYDVKIAGQVVTMSIYALPYIRWIDQGRQPGKMPPVSAILNWVNIRGLRSRGVPEHKQKSPENNLRLSWAIAKSIQKKGIPATGVVAIPWERTNKKAYTDIGNVLAKVYHNASGQMLEDLSAQYQSENIKIEIVY